MAKTRKEVLALLDEIKSIIDDKSVPDKQKIVMASRNEPYSKREKYFDKFGFDSIDIVHELLEKLTVEQYHSTITGDDGYELQVFYIPIENTDMYFKFYIGIAYWNNKRTFFIDSFHPKDDFFERKIPLTIKKQDIR